VLVMPLAAQRVKIFLTPCLELLQSVSAQNEFSVAYQLPGFTNPVDLIPSTWRKPKVLDLIMSRRKCLFSMKFESCMAFRAGTVVDSVTGKTESFYSFQHPRGFPC